MAEHDGWRHCPRCTTPLTHEDGTARCSSCGFVHYAASNPAVSALVVGEGGRVLLARRAVEPDRGLWDTLGGFLEEGEDPVAGLRRELREEAGVEVEIGDFVGGYVDSYGDEFPTSVLNLVWEVAIVAGEPAPADDVAELRWFDRNALPGDDELAFRWLAPALGGWAAS